MKVLMLIKLYIIGFPLVICRESPEDLNADDYSSFLKHLQYKAKSSWGGGDSGGDSVMAKIPLLGRIKGKRSEGMDFFGNIPYVKPPVGDLRFAPPEANLPWDPEIIDGTAFGPDCMQIRDPVHNNVPSDMSEDCLTLNVFTPAGQSSRRKLLPVMIWFHGGAFHQGGANRPEYQGKALVERSMIVVTVNYRLGALGFLVNSKVDIHGNFGLMDQRAALDWISTNIRFFGGDPNRVTLVGESAGAVMIGLHLMMDGAGKLFQKVIMQSNPFGYRFRSSKVATMLGESFTEFLECSDLQCLRAEPIEELMKAQAGLMGIPRSVGDFFPWAPTLTERTKISTQKWAMVTVTQQFPNLDMVPSNIPIILGSNKDEGELFVYSIFKTRMAKPVYQFLVGGFFRYSSPQILKHYRPYAEKIEIEAKKLASARIREEKNRQLYIENAEDLERRYDYLKQMNNTRRAKRLEQKQIKALVDTWSRGGGLEDFGGSEFLNFRGGGFEKFTRSKIKRVKDMIDDLPLISRRAYYTEEERAKLIEHKRRERSKQKALKKAAEVVVDYRPVLSRIINDYLFRCPTWRYAHLISGLRRKDNREKNVYVYRFSQPTHLPGYKACWGKSCHTSELPYVFQSMSVIRSNYSTVGPIAQREAPSAPEYPYTKFLAAYREILVADRANSQDGEWDDEYSSQNQNHTYAFRRILNHFFGDYFKEDADEEIASDMAERWTAFAKTGNPNYDGSKSEWRPWRQQQRRSNQFLDDSQSENQDDVLNKFLDERGSDDLVRKRILAALKYEVAEEDRYHTELHRDSSRVKDIDTAFLKNRFIFRSSSRVNNKDLDLGLSEADLSKLQKDSQRMRILGKGINNNIEYPGWDEDFFPQLLELKWPPEERILEEDCTCDMWEELKYKY